MNITKLISFLKPSGYDPDAQAFFSAAGITDATQKSAVNTLVKDLKGYGLWSKMLAVYPLVGGTATTCKYNLKDPRDLDAAYRLTFVGGANLVISNTGIKSLITATGVYANTHFIGSSAGVYYDNVHLSFYSRTNNTNNSYDMAGDNSGNEFGNIIYGTSAGAVINRRYISASIANSYGLHTTSSTATSISRYVNASSVASSGSTTHSLISTGVPLYLLANPRQINNETSTREFAFASFGTGLTSTDVSNLYTAVQAYQTTLGRAV